MRRWPLLLGLLPLIPLLVLLLSWLEPPQRRQMAVVPEQPTTSDSLRLESGWFGSPLIKLRAELPVNTSMGLGVELLDAGGATVLELAKDGWRETGTWSEGGETGSWDESDNGVVLSLRPPRSGEYRLRLTLEDLLDTAGRPLESPLLVRVEVRNHSVNAPLLWFTALVTQLMAGIAMRATYRNWRLRKVLRVEESRVLLRCRLGGPGLVRVEVHARYERPSSDAGPLASQLKAALQLEASDALGRSCLSFQCSLPVTPHSSDGDHWLTVEEVLHLKLRERASLGLRLTLPETIADGGEPWEIEWLRLVLEDGVLSPHPVAVLTLES